MVSARVEKLNGLTPREGRVLQLLSEGLTNEAIAGRLAVSIKTVECHIDRIYDKLQVRSASVNARCAAIATAVARGMVLLSSRTLCVVLLTMATTMGGQSDHMVRLRLPRPPTVNTRVRHYE